ncbi:hypothetical protein LCGC14_0093780 [marine sediment metagenome]|uniref:PilC beta-propeller domain-containing protein n=1 Tax=marine sediment metagenome TaxID=412755 RepID=A0A0F9YGC1_9ZZZZ|nr:hypothetical protein [Phycisphaerae bacterium]HDZ43542.1 hypothetical protein [Phycisphaerae bacterium]
MGRAADFFDVTCSGEPPTDLPTLAPAVSVPLSRDLDGAWFVTGDIDGDGAIEIVTARNDSTDTIPPHVTSVTARKLDGSILWQWGDPTAGGFRLGYDVACQIHDWDGDGKAEVILLTRGELVELDGATGRERRRIKIPDDATDCVNFADLDGVGHRGQVIVKDRYYNVYALDYDGRLRWHIAWPGGHRTAHQPYAMDIDGDGREEVLVGYGLADPDGKLRWTFTPPPYPEPLGHLDACRVFRRGPSPADWRLVCTCCGHRGIVMLDGEGRIQWALTQRHYESIDIGRIVPGDPTPRIVVDVGQEPNDQSLLMVIDGSGTQLGRIMMEHPRLHTTLDALGLGYDQILQADARGVLGHRGQWLGRIDLPGAGNTVQKGDMTGSGCVGLAISTGDSETGDGAMIHLFDISGPHATKTDILGCGENFTLY